MKKINVLLLIIILLFNTRIGVNAQSSNNAFYETTIDNSIVYTSDDINLPSSGNYYFGLTSNDKVWYVSMNKAIPLALKLHL